MIYLLYGLAGLIVLELVASAIEHCRANKIRNPFKRKDK